MDSELNYVLISVMITCTAFIGAINSKGTSRMILSYILAFICLAVTTVYTTQFFTTVSNKRATKIAGEASKMIETKLEEMDQLEDDGQLDEENAQKRKAVEDYKEKAGNLLVKMKRLGARLRNMELEPNSDEEYEQLLQRANSYLGEMRAYRKQVKALDAPDEMKGAQDKLNKASEVMLYGCSKMKRYFNAENEAEEIESSQIFKAKTRQATHLLSQAESELN